MKIKEIRQVKTNRTLDYFGSPSVDCDMCCTPLVRDQQMWKAIVTDSYLKTAAYVCCECHNAWTGKDEDLFLEAMRRRKNYMDGIVTSAPTF